MGVHCKLMRAPVVSLQNVGLITEKPWRERERDPSPIKKGCSVAQRQGWSEKGRGL